MGFFSKLFKRGSAESLDFMRRPESFSFVAIPGSFDDARAMLEACGYRLQKGMDYEGPFFELYESIRQIELAKALILVPGYTLIVDPEMVLCLEDDYLSKASEAAATPMLGVIWERYSETVFFTVFRNGQMESRTMCVAGSLSSEDAKNPIDVLVQSPTHETLLTLLEQHGLPTEQVFGDVKSMVLQLTSAEESES